MTPDTGAPPAENPAPSPRYRINPDAGLLERLGPEREPREAFFRNRQTGQLYRLGPEECFLLREIGAGTGFLQITAAFRARFFKTVRPRAIGDFVSKMVAMGALVTDPGPGPETGPDTRDDEQNGASSSAPDRPEGGTQFRPSGTAATDRTLAQQPIADGVAGPHAQRSPDGGEPARAQSGAGVSPGVASGHAGLAEARQRKATPHPTASQQSTEKSVPMGAAGAKARFRPQTHQIAGAAGKTGEAPGTAGQTPGDPSATAARSPRFGTAASASSPLGTDAVRVDQGGAANRQEGVRAGSKPAGGTGQLRSAADTAAAGPGDARNPKQGRSQPQDAGLDDALEDLVFGGNDTELMGEGASAKAEADAWGDDDVHTAFGADPGTRRRASFHRSDEGGDTTWKSFRRGTADAAEPGGDERPRTTGGGAADGSTGRGPSGVGVGGAGAGDMGIADRRLRYGDTRESDIAPGMIRLFNPGGLIRLLDMVFGWSGPLATAALYPLTLFAALVIFHRLPEVWADLEAGPGTLTIVGQLVLSIFTANLFRVLCVGVTAHRHGATPRHFGIIFLFYLFPRFVMDEDGVRNLPREGRLAVPAAALKSRLFLFGMGTTFWALSRQGGTMLPELAFVIGQIGLLTFVITALPVTTADGYRYLTTYFDVPMLRERAFHHVFGFPRKGPGGMRFPPPENGMGWIYVFYVVGVVLFTILIATLFAFYVSTALRDQFGGTGVLLFFALVALIMMWLSAMQRFRAAMTGKAVREAVAKAGAARKADRDAGQGAAVGAGNLPSRGGALAPALPQTRASASLPQVPGRALGPKLPPRTLPGVYADNDRRARRARWRTRLLLAVMAAVLAYVAFLPYRYEVGGDFTILPAARVLVHAGVTGELVEILVDEGDIVEEGQLLARLSDLEPSYELAVSRAELAQAQASLDGLLAGPRPEEIEVARERLARAEALLPFYQSEAERADTLLERSAISHALAARQQQEYIDAQQDIRSAEAELARVSAPATLDSIALAEALVEELQAQVEYREAVLQRVELRAPASGRIVTDNLGLELGRALAKGELFAEIENHEIARADVQISETDIGLVKEGSLVRLRAWAQSDVEWTGKVNGIAPVAEEERFGRVVRVRTEISNDHGFFRPQMTGRAKIDGAEMRTWEAFTRMFDRFFRIEVWGWIP